MTLSDRRVKHEHTGKEAYDAHTEITGKEAYDAHTEPIFQRLKILTFNQTYWFHLRKFMYTYLYHRQMLPLNFNSFFQHISEIHVYNTRNSSLYAVPYCRTNIRQFSVNY